MPNVLLGNLSAQIGLGEPNQGYQRLVSACRPALRNLVEAAILYDKIYIPTNDFISLALIAGALGEALTGTLLERGIVTFARYRGFLGYAGNGGGLHLLNVKSPDREIRPQSAPTRQAIDWAVNGLNSVIDKTGLAEKAMRASLDLKVNDGLIRDAALRDLSLLANALPRLKGQHIDRLPGIPPDQVRSFADVPGAPESDAVDLALRFGFSAIEVQAATSCGCDDLFTSPENGKAFHFVGRAIAAASGGQTAPSPESYFAMHELPDVPDIGEVVLADPTVADGLLRLRDSAEGVAFRRWFHENCRQRPAEAAKAYGEFLRQVPAAGSAPTRILRFLAGAPVDSRTTFTFSGPLTGPGAGTIAGAIDTFLIAHLRNGRPPKLFLEKLARL